MQNNGTTFGLVLNDPQVQAMSHAGNRGQSGQYLSLQGKKPAGSNKFILLFNNISFFLYEFLHLN